MEEFDFRGTDFDNKLTSVNRKITSDKIKYLEVQNKNE